MNALPQRASTVIVGGGIQGLMLAFCLAERGSRDTVVLDAGYWQGGASGRNGTMVRGGFASTEWTRFFGRSLELWIGLSRRLGENVMFTRRGYAILAESDAMDGLLDTMTATHRQCGLQSRRLAASQIVDVLPHADHARIRGALYFDHGGIAPHHAVMKGLRKACTDRGVKLFYGTPVTGFETSNGRLAGVLCGEHRIAADATVICCGAQNTRVAALAGLELNGEAHRIEAMATEPMRPVIGPGIALPERFTYLHQTARGEIVGGSETPGETPRESLANTVPIMAAFARHLVEMFPCLGDLRILRHWTGMLHVTDDHAPMMGPHPDIADLWISGGWMYGIAGAPAAGDMLAQAIVSGVTDDRMAPFAVDRFRRGALITEGSTVNV